MNYKIKSRIWVELDGEEFLGEGKIKLLNAINETGSLSKAAKLMKISYKKAWHLLDAVNKSSKQPVIIMSIGGKGGGGTELTDYGKSLIRVFEEINKNCWNFLDIQLKKMKSL